MVEKMVNDLNSEINNKILKISINCNQFELNLLNFFIIFYILSSIILP